MTLLSYKRPIVLLDGVIDRCYRLKKIGSRTVQILDLRYEPDGKFVGLSEDRLTDASSNFSTAQGLEVGRVWIGETGECNVNFTLNPKDGTKADSLPINECLRLLNYLQ